MKKYTCSVCGYVYDEEKGDPDSGIAPGTKWEDVPDSWVCPVCGAAKSEFAEQDFSLIDFSGSGGESRTASSSPAFVYYS